MLQNNYFVSKSYKIVKNCTCIKKRGSKSQIVGCFSRFFGTSAWKKFNLALAQKGEEKRGQLDESGTIHRFGTPINSWKRPFFGWDRYRHFMQKCDRI